MFGKVHKSFAWLSVAVCALAGPRAARVKANVFDLPNGQTSLSLVTIGDPGNQADPLTGYGSVPYVYQMYTYDVTVAQYTAMLNSVASSDPEGLYNSSMNPGNNPASCGIIQSGSPGSYTYSYVAGHENFPVNAVSWGDAARFCNWMANGQPDTGVENASTTEDGSYALNGALTDKQLDAVTRAPNATYVIPTENEFYKAAYFQPGRTDGYWLYPTQSDTPPSNVLSMTGTNNANFYDPNLGLTNPPSELTVVGTFGGSPGPYGTFDMGGDVYQWTETVVNGHRVQRGGDFAGPVSNLASGSYFTDAPSDFDIEAGIRVAEVPEPTSTFFMALAALAGLGRFRRR